MQINDLEHCAGVELEEGMEHSAASLHGDRTFVPSQENSL